MIDEREVQELREQLAQQNLRLHGVERKFPVWAQNRGISRERHIHDLSKHKIGSFGFGGIVHYDYVVDASYTGAAGATITLSGGSTAKIYATIAGAFANAVTVGGPKSFRINRGTYNEQVTSVPGANDNWDIWGEGAETENADDGGVTNWAATANNQNLWVASPASGGSGIRIHGIHFDLGTFTGCKGVDLGSSNDEGPPLTLDLFECSFETGGDTTSVGLSLGSSVSNEQSAIDCHFYGSGVGLRMWNSAVIRGGKNFSAVGIETVGSRMARINSVEVLSIKLGNASINANSYNVHIHGCNLSSDSGIYTVAGVNISGLRISDNHINSGGSSPFSVYAIDFSALTVNSDAIEITDNHITTTGSGRGILLDANLRSGLITDNTFLNMTAANAISGAGGSALTGFHNKAVDSSGVDLPLADFGTPVGHLGASGVAAVIVQEDDSTVSAGANTIDFTEPDGTLLTVTGSAPTQEVDVNMALYAKLAGRASGQIVYGGTATLRPLTLIGNSVDVGSSVQTNLAYNPAVTLTTTLPDGTGTSVVYTSTGDQINVGDYIQIDSEAMFVQAVNASTNTLTVARAQLGTSGASHTSGVSIVQAYPNNQNAFTRINGRLGIGRGNVGSTASTLNATRLAVSDNREVILPSGTTPFIYDLIGGYCDATLGVGLTSWRGVSVTGSLFMGGFNSTNVFGMNFAPTIQSSSSNSTITNLAGANFTGITSVSGATTLSITNYSGVILNAAVNSASVLVTTRRLAFAQTPNTIGIPSAHVALDIGNQSSAGSVPRSLRVLGSAPSVHGPNLGLGSLTTSSAYSPVVTLAANISSTTATTTTYTSAGDPIAAFDHILVNSEAMLVTAVDIGTKTLTIVRGQLGTTAVATHLSGDAVTKVLAAPAETLHLFSGGIQFPSVGQLKDSAGIARVEIVTDGRPGGSTPFTQAATINDAGGISSSDTTFTYLGGEGATAPFFVIGQYILIESEALLITNLNTTTNTLTVTRGVLGTTAASHADGTAITLTKDVRVDINGIVRYDDFVVGDASFLGYSTKEILVKSTLTEPTKTGTGTGNMHLTPQEHQYAASTNFRVEIDTAGNMTPLYTVAEYGTAVTLFADIDFGDTTFGYTSSGDPIAVNDYIKINAEVMLVTARDTVADTITVTRARLDTSAIQHTEGAIIYKVTIVQPHATYRWSDDGGATWDASLIPVHSNQAAIGNNIYIRFTNGFTDPHFVLSDRWEFTAIGTASQVELLRADTVNDVLRLRNVDFTVSTSSFLQPFTGVFTYTGALHTPDRIRFGSMRVEAAGSHDDQIAVALDLSAYAASAKNGIVTVGLNVTGGSLVSQTGTMASHTGISVSTTFAGSVAQFAYGIDIGSMTSSDPVTGQAILLNLIGTPSGGGLNAAIRQSSTACVNRLAAATLIGADASPAAGVALELRAGALRMAATANDYIQDSSGNRHITFATDTNVVAVTTTIGGVLRVNDRAFVNATPTTTDRAIISENSASISTASTDLLELNIAQTRTGNITTYRVLPVAGTLELADFNATTVLGLSFAPTVQNATGTSSLTTMIAANIAPIVAAGAGATLNTTTIDVLRIGGSFTAAGTHTVTTLSGISLLAGTITATITTRNGILIGNLADSDITNSYAIDIGAQTGSATSSNGIRIALCDTYALHLSDTGGTAPGGITWGADTNLYRVAANQLKTDDSLGINATPAARLHVYEGTLGNEVLRLESTATNDDPRESVYQNRVATTDATVTTIQTVAIPTDTVVFIEAKIVARRTGGTSVLGATGDGGGWVVRNAYRNVGGTVTEATVTVGTEADFESLHTATWGTPDMAVSGTNAIVRVTGAADTNITFHATVRTWQVAS